MLGTGQSARAGAVEDCLHFVDLLVYQDERIQQRGARNDRGSVLIVVKYRNAHSAPQLFFNHETIRRFDVLQINPAESWFQHLAGANHILRIAGSQFQIEDVDIGEAFEQNAFSFHHRLAG